MAIFTAETDALSLAAGAKTVLQIATASTARLRVVEVGISMNGTDATDAPALWRLMRQTTAGTTPGATLPVKFDPADVAVKSAAYRGVYAAEPTSSDILEAWYISPVGGLFVKQWPLGREPIIAASAYLGLQATTADTVSAAAYITFEEY